MSQASSTCGEPGPSNASPLPLNEDREPEPSRRRGKKRSLIEMFKEEMAREEAREEARQKAADERANRLLNLLEILKKK